MAAYLPACGSDPICPTDAHEELVQECENIWKQMEKCHLMLLNLETETPLESNEEISLLTVQMKALTAEYNQWQKKSPELISTNPDVLLTLGKKELQKVKNDLLMVMSTVQSKNKQLEEDLKREQQWHEEQEQVLHVLNKLEEETKTQAKQLYKPSLNTMELNEVKKEVLKLKTYKQELLKALYEFLEEHFPLPEKGTRATKKLSLQKSSEEVVPLLPLQKILEILINKLMYEPHDPYVTINDSFWPPYIELLLRNGIAQRHSEDVNKIRLEAFHM